MARHDRISHIAAAISALALQWLGRFAAAAATSTRQRRVTRPESCRVLSREEFGDRHAEMGRIAEQFGRRRPAFTLLGLPIVVIGNSARFRELPLRLSARFPQSTQLAADVLVDLFRLITHRRPFSRMRNMTFSIAVHN